MNARLAAVGAALALGAVVTASGELDNTVSLDSAREIWSDFLRDADGVGLEFTRLTDAEEIRLGAELAAATAGWAAADPRDSAYVTAVGKALLPQVSRPAIPYTFTVLESPQVNAFALPGGRVFVLRGMMEALRSEAELAAVVGHEIAHIDKRHAVERFQFRVAFRRAGFEDAGAAMDAARAFAAVGYTQFQEEEADAEAARLVAAAGYDARAAAELFGRLQRGARRPESAPRTPGGELAGAMGRALADFFRTHPDSPRRAAILRRAAQAGNGPRYRGVKNYSLRVPRPVTAWPDEYPPQP